MSQSKCATAMFGIALFIGAVIGVTLVFVVFLANFRSMPSAAPNLESWLGAVRVSSVAALVGGVVGALTGGASFSVAALAFLLLRRRQPLPVRASAIGIGSAVGASLVLWFVASRPSVSVPFETFAVLSAVAAGLAVAALLVTERIDRRSIA